MKIFGLPGTSFSPRRALGVDVIKRNIAKATGVPPPGRPKSAFGKSLRVLYYR